MGRILSFILLLVIVLFGLSFAMLNADTVTLQFYLGQLDMPLSLALVLALILGAVLGVLAAAGVVLRQRRELHRLRRRTADAQKELEELRKLPLREPA